MRPPKRTSIVARTRATLQPRATRADAAVKRAAAEADAKRAYPTTPSGVALKNKSSERCRDPRKLASADAKKTATAKTPKRVSLEALKALTGTRLRVFWPLENAFFKGKVVAFDRFTMKHRVRYEDGDAEWLELFRERVRWDQPPSDVARAAAAAAAAREPPTQSVFVSSKAAGKKKSNGSLAVKKKGGKETGGAKAATKSAKTKPGASARRATPSETTSFRLSKPAVRNAKSASAATHALGTHALATYAAATHTKDASAEPSPIAVADSVPATPAILPAPATAPASTPRAGIYAGSKIDIILSVAVPALRAAGARGLRSVDIMEALYAAGKGHALADRKAKKVGVLAALDRGAAVGILRKLRVGGATKRYQLAAFDPPSEFELEPSRASKQKPPKPRPVDGTPSELAPKPTRTPPTRDAAPPARYRAGADFADVLEEAEAASHGPAMQPHMKLSEEEAWACHSESVWEPLAPEAVRDAWVCCEAPGCGKWRRVPAVVAARVDEASDAGWRCVDSRDARFARGATRPRNCRATTSTSASP